MTAWAASSEGTQTSRQAHGSVSSPCQTVIRRLAGHVNMTRDTTAGPDAGCWRVAGTSPGLRPLAVPEATHTACAKQRALWRSARGELPAHTWRAPHGSSGAHAVSHPRVWGVARRPHVLSRRARQTASPQTDDTTASLTLARTHTPCLGLRGTDLLSR